MTDWQPIETAPKDGTVVDLWADGRLANCLWERHLDDHWRQQYSEATGSSFGVSDLLPTHWMPLPEPPQLSSAARAARKIMRDPAKSKAARVAAGSDLTQRLRAATGGRNGDP